MSALPPPTSSSSSSSAASSSSNSSMSASGNAQQLHGNMRWKSASSAHSNVNTYRNMILLEKKRKSHEVAVSDMSNALLEETLAGLRGKARDLQDDKWMYEDIRI